MQLRMKKEKGNKIKFKGRIVISDGSEYSMQSLRLCDDSALDYTCGHLKSAGKRVNFRKIIRKFENNDVVEFTVKKIGVGV